MEQRWWANRVFESGLIGVSMQWSLKEKSAPWGMIRCFWVAVFNNNLCISLTWLPTIQWKLYLLGAHERMWLTKDILSDILWPMFSFIFLFCVSQMRPQSSVSGVGAVLHTNFLLTSVFLSSAERRRQGNGQLTTWWVRCREACSRRSLHPPGRCQLYSAHLRQPHHFCLSLHPW